MIKRLKKYYIKNSKFPVKKNNQNESSELVLRLIRRIEDLEQSVNFKTVQISLLQTKVISLKDKLKDAINNKM